jgi:hypothetical protein
LVPGEKYIFSGGISDTKQLILYYTDNSNTLVTVGAEEVMFEATADAMSVGIICPVGEVFDGETFYPMIRKADIIDSTYEPFQGGSVKDKLSDRDSHTNDVVHTMACSPDKIPSMALISSLFGGLSGFKLMKAEDYEANEEANGTWVENTLYVLWSEEE